MDRRKANMILEKLAFDIDTTLEAYDTTLDEIMQFNDLPDFANYFPLIKCPFCGSIIPLNLECSHCKKAIPLKSVVEDRTEKLSQKL